LVPNLLSAAIAKIVTSATSGFKIADISSGWLNLGAKPTSRIWAGSGPTAFEMTATVPAVHSWMRRFDYLGRIAISALRATQRGMIAQKAFLTTAAESDNQLKSPALSASIL